jgi:predicted  nucleic acid-binding Zn-ribbon protein
MPTLQDTYLEQLEALQRRLDDALARLARHGDQAAPRRAEGEKLQLLRARLHDRLRNVDDRKRAARAATSGLDEEFHRLSETAEKWIKSID